MGSVRPREISAFTVPLRANGLCGGVGEFQKFIQRTNRLLAALCKSSENNTGGLRMNCGFDWNTLISLLALVVAIVELLLDHINKK